MVIFDEVKIICSGNLYDIVIVFSLCAVSFVIIGWKQAGCYVA